MFPHPDRRTPRRLVALAAVLIFAMPAWAGGYNPGGSGSSSLSATKYVVTTSGGNWTVNGTAAGAIAAATTQTITLFTMPAQGKLLGLTLKHATAFSGTGITDVTVSCGWSGSATAYSGTTLDIFQSVGNTAMLDQGGWYSPNFGAHAVTLTFSATGANLNNISAGSLTVWVVTTILP
jgi:hypothetical protein